MAYAIISFIDDGATSVIPTNWLQKDENDLLCWWPPTNLTLLLAERVKPDIKTWSLRPVKIEKYCCTLQKAREAAENENYTSTDEMELSREYRRKKPNRYILYSENESEEDNADNVNSRDKRNTPIKLKNQEMPQWPKSVNENENAHSFSTFTPPSSTNTHNEEKETQEEIESARGYKHSIQEPNQEIPIQNTEENIRTLIKMVAEVQLQMKDILVVQRINRITPTVKIVSSIEWIKNFLPLKSIEDIENIQSLLQCEDFVNEYITFIQKIGGHKPKENIRNVLTRMFSNECAMKCRWKGRGQNFAICKLRLITIMKETILKLHTNLTEIEFYEAAADWFRSAKQRHDRELKNSPYK